MDLQTTIVDGRRWTARPFRREVYLRARAQGVDTLQYTHRSEGVFRFEIVDLRIPDGEVPAAGKLLTYLQRVNNTTTNNSWRRRRSMVTPPAAACVRFFGCMAQGNEEPDAH